MIFQQTKAQYRLKDLLEAFPQNIYLNKKKELANKLGISTHQLGRFIRGNSDPSGTQLKIMAEFFGCLVDDLYQKTEVSS